MKLFISYRRKSWAFTDHLANALRERMDAEIFIDRESIDEPDFERSISRHLRESDAVLLIVSEYTFAPERIFNDDDWVRREIREALTADIPIVMAFIDGQTPPANLPDDIKDIGRKQGIPFYPDYFEAGVDKLAQFIIKAVPRRPESELAATASVRSREVADETTPVIYRKHVTAFVGSVLLPALLAGSALFYVATPTFSSTELFPELRLLSQVVSLSLAVIAAIWVISAYWLWRNEMLILSSDTIQVIRKRPLWLQDQSESIRLTAVENVLSNRRGLVDHIFNRGGLLVERRGSETRREIFTNVPDPEALQREIWRRAEIAQKRTHTDK